MKLEDWYIGYYPESGKRVCWERADSDGFPGVVEVPREEWTSDDFLFLVQNLLIIAHQYKAERLPIFLMSRLNDLGLPEKEKRKLAEGFAEDCFEYIGNRI